MLNSILFWPQYDFDSKIIGSLFILSNSIQHMYCCMSWKLQALWGTRWAAESSPIYASKPHKKQAEPFREVTGVEVCPNWKSVIIAVFIGMSYLCAEDCSVPWIWSSHSLINVGYMGLGRCSNRWTQGHWWLADCTRILQTPLWWKKKDLNEEAFSLYKIQLCVEVQF